MSYSTIFSRGKFYIPNKNNTNLLVELKKNVNKLEGRGLKLVLNNDDEIHLWPSDSSSSIKFEENETFAILSGDVYNSYWTSGKHAYTNPKVWDNWGLGDLQVSDSDVDHALLFPTTADSISAQLFGKDGFSSISPEARSSEIFAPYSFDDNQTRIVSNQLVEKDILLKTLSFSKIDLIPDENNTNIVINSNNPSSIAYFLGLDLQEGGGLFIDMDNCNISLWPETNEQKVNIKLLDLDKVQISGFKRFSDIKGSLPQSNFAINSVSVSSDILNSKTKNTFRLPKVQDFGEVQTTEKILNPIEGMIIDNIKTHINSKGNRTASITVNNQEQRHVLMSALWFSARTTTEEGWLINYKKYKPKYKKQTLSADDFKIINELKQLKKFVDNFNRTNKNSIGVTGAGSQSHYTHEFVFTSFPRAHLITNVVNNKLNVVLKITWVPQGPYHAGLSVDDEWAPYDAHNQDQYFHPGFGNDPFTVDNNSFEFNRGFVSNRGAGYMTFAAEYENSWDDSVVYHLNPDGTGYNYDFPKGQVTDLGAVFGVPAKAVNALKLDFAKVDRKTKKVTNFSYMMNSGDAPTQLAGETNPNFLAQEAGNDILMSIATGYVNFTFNAGQYEGPPHYDYDPRYPQYPCNIGEWKTIPSDKFVINFYDSDTSHKISDSEKKDNPSALFVNELAKTLEHAAINIDDLFVNNHIDMFSDPSSYVCLTNITPGRMEKGNFKEHGNKQPISGIQLYPDVDINVANNELDIQVESSTYGEGNTDSDIANRLFKYIKNIAKENYGFKLSFIHADGSEISLDVWPDTSGTMKFEIDNNTIKIKNVAMKPLQNWSTLWYSNVKLKGISLSNQTILENFEYSLPTDVSKYSMMEITDMPLYTVEDLDYTQSSNQMFDINEAFENLPTFTKELKRGYDNDLKERNTDLSPTDEGEIRKQLFIKDLNSTSKSVSYEQTKKWFTREGYRGQNVNLKIWEANHNTVYSKTCLSPNANIHFVEAVDSEIRNGTKIEITNTKPLKNVFPATYNSPWFNDQWLIVDYDTGIMNGMQTASSLLNKELIRDNYTSYVKNTIMPKLDWTYDIGRNIHGAKKQWNTRYLADIERQDFIKPYLHQSYYKPFPEKKKNKIWVYPATETDPVTIVVDTQWKHKEEILNQLQKPSKVTNPNLPGQLSIQEYPEEKPLPKRHVISVKCDFLDDPEYDHLYISSLIASLWSMYDDYDNDDIMMFILVSSNGYYNSKGQYAIRLLPSQVFSNHLDSEIFLTTNPVVSVRTKPDDKSPKILPHNWVITKPDMSGKKFEAWTTLAHDMGMLNTINNWMTGTNDFYKSYGKTILQDGWGGQECSVKYYYSKDNNTKYSAEYNAFAPFADHQEMDVPGDEWKQIIIENNHIDYANNIYLSQPKENADFVTLRVAKKDGDQERIVVETNIDISDQKNITKAEEVASYISTVWSKFASIDNVHAISLVLALADSRIESNQKVFKFAPIGKLMDIPHALDGKIDLSKKKKEKGKKS